MGDHSDILKSKQDPKRDGLESRQDPERLADEEEEPEAFDSFEAELADMIGAQKTPDPVALLTPPPQALTPGALIDDRYEIEGLLGRGGFGVVYAARQRSTGQRVAIKVMHAERGVDPERQRTAEARFRREMTLIAQLRHPNIVRLIDSGALPDGHLFNVLEFIEGHPLSTLLAEEGPMGLAEARQMMLQVLDALACAHAAGVVHRDLKPQNIMIRDTGARRHATVLDFGISAIAHEFRGEDYETLTQEQSICGTPPYMAPELLRNQHILPQSDIYAWGLVFLECLQGRPVFSGPSSATIIYDQLSNTPVPIPSVLVGSQLGALLAGALIKSHDARLSDARALYQSLEACSLADLPPVLARQAPVPTPTLGTDPTLDTASSMGTDPTLGAGASVGTDPTLDAGPSIGTDPTLGAPLTGPEALGVATTVDSGPMGASSLATDPTLEAVDAGPVTGAATSEAQGASRGADVDGVVPPADAPASPEAQARTTEPPSRALAWGGGAALVAALALGIWWQSSGSLPDHAAQPPGADVGLPGPTAPLAADDAGGAPEVTPETPAWRHKLIPVPAAPVIIGLKPEALDELRKRYPQNAMDLYPGTGLLPYDGAWRRPALEVMADEVTWGDWERASQGDPQLAGICEDRWQPGAPDAPVTGVGAEEAQRFCQSLQMRLPTAREWEGLARGSQGRAFGFEPDPGADAWTLSDDQLAALRQQGPPPAWSVTPEGLRGLTGGVSEWVTCQSGSLEYCVDGFAHRGGSWRFEQLSERPEPALLLAPLINVLGDAPRCLRRSDIGLRCVKDRPSTP